jgi:hypothetical protein
MKKLIMKKLIIIAFIALIALATPALALDSLRFYRNYSGDQTFAVPQGYVNTYLLTANVAKAITIPTGSRYVLFAATADIWVRIGSGTAAIPSGDTTSGTAAELNPVCRWIESETQMSIISPVGAKVSLSYYQ